MLDLAVKEAGNKNAFEYKNGDKIVKITYKQYVDDINSLGTALASLNMHNKHVAIIGENSYKWLTVYLCMLQSTGVFVPVDRELTCLDVINVLKHSDSEVLFFSKKYAQYIPEIKKSIPNIKYYIGLDVKKDEDNILSYDLLKESGKKLLDKKSTIYTYRT